DQPFVAMHLPAFMQKATGELLAAGAAAEDENTAAEKPGARGKLQCGFATQTGAVEQDGFRWQVFEPAARFDRYGLYDFGRGGGRAVNLFRRRGGDVRGGRGPDAQLNAQPVTGDEAAGGGDHHGHRNIARGRVGE